MKALRFLPCALLCLLLSACLEFNEVAQLKPDGGVDFTLSIRLPDFPDKKEGDAKQKEAEQDIEAVFKSLGDGIQLKGRDEKTEYGKTTFTIRAEMDSLAGIGAMYRGLGKSDAGKAKKEGQEVFEQIFSQKNEYVVKATKGGSLLISRSFTPPKAAKKKSGAKDSKDEDFSKKMEETMLNAMTFRFEVFVPTEILSSNASQRFGNNLRWDVSLGYLAKNPFKMEFEIAATPEMTARLLKK